MSQHRRHFILTALAAVVTTLPGCNGGDGDDEAVDAPTLTVLTSADAARSIVKTDGGWRAEAVTSSSGEIEGVLSSPQGQNRIFTDSDGRVQALRLADGRTLRIAYPAAGRVDVTAADAAGTVLWALTFFEQGGRLMAAPLGTALDGVQINATLSGPLDGALTVSADPSDPMRGVDVARAAAVDAGLVALLTAPGTGASGLTARALGAARVLATPGEQIATGIVQAGVLAPLLIYAGVSLGALVGGAAASGLLVTAGGLLLVGAAAYALASGLSNITNGAVRALMSDSLDELGSSGATETSLTARMRDAVTSMVSSGAALAERTLNVVRAAATPADNTVTAAGVGTLPALAGALAAIAAQVRGVLVDTTGRLFSGTGRLDPAGALGLLLTAPDGTRANLTAQRSGTSVAGTFDVDGRSGSVAGTQSAVGQCNASSSSGGSGTFSYAYNIGAASGSFPFRYEMFGIPDQARIVDIAGRELFNTGGLVSGNRMATVLLAGEANVVVLINAPNNGTAWEFTIGCGT